MGEERKAIRLEDGTKAEKVVREVQTDTGEVQTITEIWAEPVIEKKLTTRVSEFRKPIVYRRETETIDQASGNVIDKTVESLEPDVKMEMRDHIVSSQSVEEEPKENCYVTRDDLKDLLASVLSSRETASSPAVSAQSIIEERASQSEPLSTKSLVLLMTLAAEVAALVYICFWM